MNIDEDTIRSALTLILADQEREVEISRQYLARVICPPDPDPRERPDDWCRPEPAPEPY